MGRDRTRLERLEQLNASGPVLSVTGTVGEINVTAGANPVVSLSATFKTAGGDLSGTYPSPTVVQWQGVPIAATPSDSNIYIYNGLTTTWSLASLSGDVTMTRSGSVAIGAGKVTLAQQANVATSTVFYRKTAGTGAPEVQTLATLKTDLGLTGTNSGDITLAAVGAVPNANGASLAGQVLNLQPADGSNPGTLTATTQTIGGNKTFNGSVGVGAAPVAKFDVTGFMRAAAATVSAPASGKGIEIYYDSGADNGGMLSFDRTGAAYKAFLIDGLTVALRPSGTAVLTASAALCTIAGDCDISTVGKGLKVAEGTNAKQGTAVLVAGTKVVNNTAVTANSRILLTSQVDGGTPGFLRVSTRTAGTSFTITSSSGTDTSTVAYEIFEPG